MRTIYIFTTMMVSGWMASVSADSLNEAIADQVDAVTERVVAWRRDIHANPELSNREFRTSALVAEHLRSLGIDVQTGVAHTGVVGVLKGGKPGPVIALRADMDGLPVTEKTGLPYASTVRGEYQGREVGVMHACGHDNHVAILMGAAEVLAAVKRICRVRLNFSFSLLRKGRPRAETGARR